MSNYPNCETCMDTGEVFTHSEDCQSDFCALNGDFYSCVGQVVPCQCPAGEEMRDPETDEELDAELAGYGVTPEMRAASLSKLKAGLGLPDWCQNVRCGIARECTCPAPQNTAA